MAKPRSATAPKEVIEKPTPAQVGIFVLHYEKDAVTHDCVNSWLGEAQELEAAIYVIDNGSPAPFMPLLQWHGIDVIRHEKNLFLIDAFNKAIEAMPSHEYTVCITNDTQKNQAYPFLLGLIHALEDKSVGVVAPGTTDRGSGTLYVHPPMVRADHTTNHIDNTVWAWRQDVIDKVGLPSCAGHTHRACWYSNKEFCYRLRKAGFKVLAATGSSYVEHAHDGGQDRVAHQEGQAWLKGILGERYSEAW